MTTESSLTKSEMNILIQENHKLLNIGSWCENTSVLNHSTVDLQDFSKRPPVNLNQPEPMYF